MNDELFTAVAIALLVLGTALFAILSVRNIQSFLYPLGAINQTTD